MCVGTVSAAFFVCTAPARVRRNIESGSLSEVRTILNGRVASTRTAKEPWIITGPFVTPAGTTRSYRCSGSTTRTSDGRTVVWRTWKSSASDVTWNCTSRETVPFKSEAQRRWMWANRPAQAEAWSHGRSSVTGRKESASQQGKRKSKRASRRGGRRTR